MSKKIKWGILGAGAIGSTFAKNLKSSRTGELHAVASRSIDKANKFGDEFGAPVRHGSYEALLADPSVDAVYVCTPHTFHAEWAIKSANAGKHILVEKPFALNQWEATAILEAATLNKVFAMEAFMYRCHPQTAKLVEIIKSGVIGEVRLIQATFGFQAGFNAESRLYNNDLAGGGIMDVGCYPVSMSRLIAGAATGQPFADPIEVKGVAALAETGVDLYAVASLKFPGQIVASLSTGVGLNQENVVRIFGSEGNILLPNPWTANRTAADTGKITIRRNGKDPEELTQEASNTSFGLEADHFAAAVFAKQQQAQSPAMTWGDTMGQLHTLDRWREQAGVIYNQEKPQNYKHTVDRAPLKVQAGHNMPYGKIAHVQKPVSRLIMGVDNQNTIAHASVMFDDYFARGGNTFDTAHIYANGKQEILLGDWIANRGVRDQVNVIVKGAHTPFCNPLNLSQQLVSSLERLKIDSADIYLMHRDNLEIPVGEFVDVLNQHVKAGRIKAFGGSNWSIKRIEEANAYAKANNLQGFEILSNNFSLARMVQAVWNGCIAASDPDSRAWLTKHQMPLLSWSSQARGFFTDRSGPDKLDDKSLVHSWYSPDNFQRKERVLELAAKLKATPIAIALAYVLHQPFPTFALIGPRTLSETRTSLEALDLKLTPEQVKWLNLEA